MKKEILEALKAKFQGVSDSILSRIADKLAKTATTSEDVKTSVEGVTIQQVIESYGDSRATEASHTARQNAVHDYESKYGLKDGVKITGQSGVGDQSSATTTDLNGEGEDATPAWAKSLIERMDRIEASRTGEIRKQQLYAITGKLPESIRKAYDRLPLDAYSDDQFRQVLGEITTEVEGIANATAARGGVFGKPSASTGGGTNTELTAEQKAAIAHRDGVNAGDQQPF
ncbi:MAG: hypothetical protein ACI4AK_05875 [Lepagella sp.]